MNMDNHKRLRAAVIGLGKAGSRFDEEPRGVIWSHVGAYLALPDTFELVAGVDPNEENRAQFLAQCPTVGAYRQVRELKALEIDVFSIATPHDIRLEIFEEIFSRDQLPKSIICEKPLAINAETRNRLVSLCEANGVNLLVNYNRRYTEVYQKFESMLSQKVIGDLLSITLRVPNRVWSVGSHAVDLLLYLVGEAPEEWKSLILPRLNERGEPAIDFICRFPSGAAGRVLTQATSEFLIFEVDAVGTKGRIIAHGNGKYLDLITYDKSSKYAGYFEPTRPDRIFESSNNESTFIRIVKEAAELSFCKNQQQNRNTISAILSENLIDQIIAKT